MSILPPLFYQNPSFLPFFMRQLAKLLLRFVFHLLISFFMPSFNYVVYSY
ncbi:hypothetical protein LguiA_006210 [Lonicera macranthoides]